MQKRTCKQNKKNTLNQLLYQLMMNLTIRGTKIVFYPSRLGCPKSLNKAEAITNLELQDYPFNKEHSNHQSMWALKNLSRSMFFF